MAGLGSDWVTIAAFSIHQRICELESMCVSSAPKEGSDTMLVLSRKLGEKICIGQNIFLTVVDIERGKVRLGIEAPRDIPIYRQELLAQPDANGQPPVSNEVHAAPK
jgi:carbon storage regulator